MEFSFNINNLFGDDIYKVDKTLLPSRSCPRSNEFKKQLCDVVDQMGEASAKAQSLRGAITSSSKLVYSDHLLYVMKDSGANSGLGAVLGILKIGTKKLFVYDANGVHHEMEPMCVLDFYVHESRQRTGCGRRLFDYMLKDQNIKAAHLAIDKPSHKFSQFLQKHYHLKATIPQVNNFVIFMGYFQDRHNGGRASRNNNVNSRPPLHPHHRQNSGSSNNNWNNPNQMSDSLSRMEREKNETKPEKKEALKDISVVNGRLTPTGAERSLGDNSRSSSRALAGQYSSYSRHAPPLNPTQPLPDIGVNASEVGRTGPDHVQIMNSHQDVYDRRGHLKVSPGKQDTYSSSNITNRHSAPVSHQANVNINSDKSQHIDNKTVNAKSRVSLIYGPHTMMGDSSTNNNFLVQKQQQTQQNLLSVNQKMAANPDSNSDILLPKYYTPFSQLSLPVGDPYGYRQSAKKLNDSTWNVFGVQKEPKSYSASDRFRNTRPW